MPNFEVTNAEKKMLIKKRDGKKQNKAKAEGQAKKDHAPKKVESSKSETRQDKQFSKLRSKTLVANSTDIDKAIIPKVQKIFKEHKPESVFVSESKTTIFVNFSSAADCTNARSATGTSTIDHKTFEWAYQKVRT